MKRILLVNPHETEQGGFTNPPLGLLYLAGTLLKHGFDVKLVDGCIEGKEAIRSVLKEFKPDMVGITCLTPGRMKALEAARMAKDADPSVKVVLGGAHPTIMYQQMLEHYDYLDYIVLGEGETTLLELAQGKDPSQVRGIAFKADGKVMKTANRHYIENLDELPFPAWHLVDLKKYPIRGEGVHNDIDLSREPRISVVFSRGCKGHCDFCSTWWIWKGWRHRSANNMADELEFLYKTYGVRHYWFADDAMTVNKDAVMALCDEIIRRKLKIAFFVTTRTDCVDETLLRKLKSAGCYEISFGIETGSPHLLEIMGKENDIETSERAIYLAKKAGIKVTALMILGNIGESEQTIEDTINFLRRTNPDTIGTVGGLWVLPGTKVYRECKKIGFIDDDFWLTDEPYKVYTVDLSIDELKKLQKKVLNYSWREFLRRGKRLLSRGPRHALFRILELMGYTQHDKKIKK